MRSNTTRRCTAAVARRHMVHTVPGPGFDLTDRRLRAALTNAERLNASTLVLRLVCIDLE